ncbi:aminotransferase class III-fold pyridoxal phosphate-dependent enzyme, partial [Streptomyces sp. NPDC032161]|uniref:aminotransferase class III-fold pyridoxal phosphate-dependent enzyme n=1 Tax=unclassified Streptomyces TaxID=2593676 RepID=UPI0033DFBCCF
MNQNDEGRGSVEHGGRTFAQVPSHSAREHVEQTERFAARNYHPLPVVLSSGDGAWVTDVDGRRFLDCLAGYSALNFGHRP